MNGFHLTLVQQGLNNSTHTHSLQSAGLTALLSEGQAEQREK